MADEVVNVDMAAAWDGQEGDDWADQWEHHDRAIRGHHEALIAAAAFQPADRVLDVGCGNGQTTRAAARAAVDGAALGIDLSSRMLERARALAAEEGLTNVAFEQADAQVHRFEADAYDAVVSRFGAMFFADPVAAFANVRAALRPGGRLVMVAWRELADNEWVQAARNAFAAGRDLPVPPAGAPGPFGLADPAQTTARLHAAGFEAVEITPVDAPFSLGADVDDAFAFVRRSGVVRGLSQDLDDGQRGQALATMRDVLVAHETPDGVELGSGSWLISARRPGA
jgi:SAM-dependent methyltransferase